MVIQNFDDIGILSAFDCLRQFIVVYQHQFLLGRMNKITLAENADQFTTIDDRKNCLVGSNDMMLYCCDRHLGWHGHEIRINDRSNVLGGLDSQRCGGCIVGAVDHRDIASLCKLQQATGKLIAPCDNQGTYTHFEGWQLDRRPVTTDNEQTLCRKTHHPFSETARTHRSDGQEKVLGLVGIHCMLKLPANDRIDFTERTTQFP